MVKKCAIPLLWIMIGTSAQAQDCFYQQETHYQDGSVINSIQKYDCKSPPKTVIIEKKIPAKNRSLGEFLFGVEENGNGITHLFSSLVSMGVL
jgi:hypothetical protein